MKKEDKKEYKNSYKTPESYFEGFNERLMDKILAEEFSIPKDDGFVVPDKYFETFTNKVAYQKETKVIRLGSYKKILYGSSFGCRYYPFCFLLQSKRH